MSVFDERRKQLGITVKVPGQPDFDRRRQELLDMHETRRQRSIEQQKMRAVVASKVIPSVRQQVENINTALPKKPSVKDEWMERKAKERAEKRKTMPKAFAKVDKVLEPVTKAIDWAQANTPGLSAFQHGAGEALGVADVVDRNAAPVTGSPIVNVPARLAGGLAGLASVPGPNQLSTPFQAGKAIAGTKAAQALTKGNVLGTKAIEGAVGGGLGGAAASVIAGQSDAKDVAKNAALGVGLGAAGDVAISGIGQGMSKAAQSLLRTQVSKVAGAIDSVANSSVQSARLKVESNTEKLSRMMKDLKPIVDERMTPPLENPNELAKWLQPHLLASLNQIRKLPYEDLRQLAAEVQKGSSVMSVARQVAKERGVDLDALLDQTAPTFKQQADRLRMGGVAGAIEPPKNVKVALSNEPKRIPDESFQLPTDPSSQSLGISAFGSKVKPYDNLKTDTKSQLVTRSEKERLPVNVLADKAYTQLVDDLHPMNKFDKAVEKVTGETLDAAERSHTLALNSRGTDMISRQILTAKQVDSKGNEIGKSLKEILSALPKTKHSYVDFEDYLVNRHAVTRMVKRGEKVFDDSLEWTPEKGTAKAAAYEQRHPEFKAMADEVYAFQKNMAQKWLVDTGMLPQKVVDAWIDENPFYVPNKRFFSELEKGNGGKSFSKKGFTGQNAPVKGYQKGGSQRKIISPIESMIENVDAFVKAAKRNQSMQVLVKNSKKAPEELDGFVEIVPEHQAMGAQALKQINEMLKTDGIDGVVANLTNDFDASYRKATQTGLDKDNIVRVMMDGEPVYLKVNDKSLLGAITALGPENSSALMQMVGKVTQSFKMLTTGANPVFSLTRNLWRDIPSAYAASKTTSNPVVFMADLAKAAVQIATNGKLYQEFKNFGGGHSSPIASDRNLLSQSKRQILPRKHVLSGAVPRTLDALGDLMNAVESAPRLAEYKRSSASGLPADNVKGIFEAQDVTVNFKRRGAGFARDLDKWFPYFNAAVQGLDKFGRMYKDNPVKAGVKSFIGVSIPAMVAYAVNYNNPDYARVSQQTKDNYYLFPNPAEKGTFIKIAKPKEIGTIFADIPERLMDRFYKQDPEAFAGFADQIRTTFLPPGIQGAMKSGGITDRLGGVIGDTIGGPVVDAVRNKNFADSPIVPGYLERLSPELQSDARTSRVGKWIGEKTGTSPKQVDYLIKQYTGVIGQLGLPALTPGAGNNPLQALGSSLKSQMVVDPAYSNDSMDKFYDQKGKLDQAKTDYPVTGKYPEGYNDDRRKELGKVSDDISEIRKQMRAIESSVNIPATEKRKQLRVLQERMNQLATSAVQR